MNSPQVVSTGTQTLGCFVPVKWKQPSGECWEDLSEELMIFEQGNLDRGVVNQESGSQLIVISHSKPVILKNVKQLNSGCSANDDDHDDDDGNHTSMEGNYNRENEKHCRKRVKFNKSEIEDGKYQCENSEETYINKPKEQIHTLRVHSAVSYTETGQSSGTSLLGVREHLSKTENSNKNIHLSGSVLSGETVLGGKVSFAGTISSARTVSSDGTVSSDRTMSSSGIVSSKGTVSSVKKLSSCRTMSSAATVSTEGTVSSVGTVSSSGTVLADGTVSTDGTVPSSANDNLEGIRQSNVMKKVPLFEIECDINHSGETVNSCGTNKNVCITSGEGGSDEVCDSERLKKHTILHNYCKEIDTESEKITETTSDYEKPESLKSIKTNKYKKGYRIVDLARCLNISYVLKDSVILVSRGDNQEQNSELTKGENSYLTNNNNVQSTSELAKGVNCEVVCKGDKHSSSALTRGDNFDGIKSVTEDAQKQGNHKLGHGNPLKCTFCNRSFRDESNFQVHQLSHIAKSQKLPIKCSICLREYKTIPRINSHFKNCHSNIKTFKCEFCGKGFSCKGNFERHINTHTKTFKFPCKYCKKSFNSKSNLNGHLKQCPLRNDTRLNEFKCDCCGKSYTNQRNLLKHKSIMENRKNEQYICPKCGKEFKSKGKVNAHVREVHSTVKSFQCYKCGKCFVTNSVLNTHLRYHANSKSKPFLCCFCPKQFPSVYECQRHERTHDSSSKSIQDKEKCTVCNKWLGKSFLNQHLLKHMGLQLKTHMCTICNKHFASKHNLMVHNRLHSQVKLFTCEHCDKAFTTKSSLVRHLAFHAGFKRESKYPCEICGKTFTFNYKRKRHQAKHAECPAFECMLCRMKFHTQDELNTHLISSEQCSTGLFNKVTMATKCTSVQVKLVGKECQVSKVTSTVGLQ